MNKGEMLEKKIEASIGKIGKNMEKIKDLESVLEESKNAKGEE